ncbi:MAG: helix-turn-helix domain-containing protein [Rhodobacterales bacterium]
MSRKEPIRSLDDLGAIILRHRRRNKMTQAHLASRAAVEVKQISRIENGVIQPKITTVLSILAALDLEIFASPPRAEQEEASSMEDIF